VTKIKLFSPRSLGWLAGWQQQDKTGVGLVGSLARSLARSLVHSRGTLPRTNGILRISV